MARMGSARPFEQGIMQWPICQKTEVPSWRVSIATTLNSAGSGDFVVHPKTLQRASKTPMLRPRAYPAPQTRLRPAGVSMACLFVLAFCIAGGSAEAQTVRPLRDAQLWSRARLKYYPRPDFDVRFRGSLRFGNNLSQLAEEITGASVAYHAKPYVSFGAGYLYKGGVKSLTGYSRENRWYAEASVAQCLHHFQFSNRARSEVRWVDGARWERYRDRVQVRRRNLMPQVHLSPYLSWEDLYYTKFDEWNRKRYTAGIQVRLANRERLKLFYRYQDDLRSRPHDINIMGVTLHVRIGKQPKPLCQ